MKREKAYKLLDNANTKYKNLYDSNKEKFISLPYWLRSHSDILTKELNGKIRPNYNKFKRGSIIYVDFGVNIGSELSGGHFAIVLNHNDNKKSSSLNVIPLTSKDKKHFLPIDKTVFDNAYNTLYTSLRKLEVEIREKTNSIDKLTIEKNELIDEVEKRNNKLKLKLDNDTIKNKDEIKAAKDEVTELDNLIAIIKTKIEMKTKLVNEIQEDRDDIEKVFLKYSKYNKKTFACYKALQNISKLRVKKINKYDPSGNIKVDNNTLDKIDEKIIEEYTNKNY